MAQELPFPTVSHAHPLGIKKVQRGFLTVTVMPKKRGRPPKEQMGAKRRRGRPRKSTQPQPAQPTRRAAASATVSEPQVEPTSDEYTPGKPYVVPVAYDEGVTPVFKAKTVKPHQPKFQLTPPRPDKDNFEAVVMALTRVYLPDGYIMKVYQNTLQYIRRRRLNARDVYKLVPRDILHFFCIIYYMGYCKLPSKEDYWFPGDDIRGDHPVCVAFGMTKPKFDFIWRNVYLMEPRTEVEEDESENEGMLAYDEESIGYDYEPSYYVVREDSAEDDFHFDQKARSIIDLTNQGNKIICHWPGHVMTVDEQMNRAKGRSKETYRMNNKPIRCGYKFFSIVCRQSKFLWHMVPYGRKYTKAGTICTVKFLVESLPKRGELEYVVGMDNYFTHEGALKHCLAAGVHAMGTARRKRGWPAKELSRIDDDRFNTLYHIADRDNTYVTYRWVDNAVVTMVSTCHDPNASVVSARRRPRTTQTNRRHVQQVWGNNHVKDIAIPAVVNDYNYWKVAVDTFDQYLAYLMCDLRCVRTWTPLMIQALMTMRVNSYRAHTFICTNAKCHKKFTLMWIRCLMRRAIKLQRHTRDSLVQEAQTASPLRRFRMSSKNPTLPAVRHSADVTHAPVLAAKQGKCIYCRYQYLCKKVEMPDADPTVWGVIRQPQRKCLGCGHYVCKDCWAVYHS